MNLTKNDRWFLVQIKEIVDLDGQQLLPELRYYGQCLSSEAPGSFLALTGKAAKTACGKMAAQEDRGF